MAEGNDNVKFNIFVDDRAIWCFAKSPVEYLKRARDRPNEIDTMMGLKMKPCKCDIFVTTTECRKEADEKPGEFVDNKECVHTFELLGVTYNTTKYHRAQHNADENKKIMEYLTRLAQATRKTKGN